jgi:hypothetical protein
MDIDTIQPGVDFAQAIQDEVARCDVVLAIIGKRWLNPTARRRLAEPTDYVRIELTSALERGIPLKIQWLFRREV